MPTEPGVFEAFYAGPIQHPILLWLAAGIATALCLSRRDLSPSLRRYCAVLGALSIVDAWLTTNEVFGLGPLRGWLASAVPLFFVLAGDLRYLLLVTSADAAGEIHFERRGLAAAAGLTLIVPIFSQVATLLLPESLDRESLDRARLLFLVYEVAFASLTLVLIARHPKVRKVAWIRRVSRFVVLYYGLWASADLVILVTGSDLGYLLRVVPNLLYYGGLIAMMGGSAPAPSPRRAS